MAKNIYENLSQLGASSELPRSPSEATLETVPNPHQKTIYLVRFTAPEFTSLCPVTAQADFAHFVIDYVPGKLIVESKSLKLFLTMTLARSRWAPLSPLLLVSRSLVVTLGTSLL